MASVVTMKPKSALDELKMSKSAESDNSDSTELPSDLESAYGSNCPSECDINLELQNSVLEIPENVENNTQKLEYFKKSDSILRNLFMAVKNENDLLKKQNDAVENKCVALQNSCEVLDSEKDSLKSLNVILQEKCKMLETQAIVLNKDIDRLTNLNVVLQKSKDVEQKIIDSLKKDNEVLEKK